jgi:5-methylcytosine-specific restriction endonuclease McrA
MSVKDPVKVIDHPKGPNCVVSSSRAFIWVKAGKAVYFDDQRKTIRFIGQRRNVPIPSWGRAMRPLDPDWNGQDLPTHPRAAVALAKYEAERRERESKAVGCHSITEWNEVLQKYGNRCLRCKIRAQDTFRGKLTRDHVVPLASGGTDFASNLQPLCQRCNSWKGNREIDFRPSFKDDNLSAFPPNGVIAP